MSFDDQATTTGSSGRPSVRRGGSANAKGVRQRATFVWRDEDESDEARPAIVLDEQEQEEVIADLTDTNRQSNKHFRQLMLVMLSLCLVLYLIHFHAVVSSSYPSEAILIPLPIYFSSSSSSETDPPSRVAHFIFTIWQSVALGFAASLTLRQLYWNGASASTEPGSLSSASGTGDGDSVVAAAVPPASRPFYPRHTDVFFAEDPVAYISRTCSVGVTLPRVLLASLLPPFLVLIAPTSMSWSARKLEVTWWGVGAAAVGITCLVERWIEESESDLGRLGDLKYRYKGA